VQEREVANSPDETFDLGPYLMAPSTDRVVIMWRSLEELPGRVLYGPGDQTNLEASHAGVARIHEVELTGLEPDTRYAYRVQSEDRESDLHHFYTAVNPGQGFRFVAFGDNQNGPDIFAQVAEDIIDARPHIVLGLGDHVQTGSQEELWKTQLFQPARALFHEVAFFAAMGNHEESASHYYDLYSYPHPAGEPSHESYYSFTYGNAFLLAFDPYQLPCPFGEVHTPESQWLWDAVASPQAQAATWRIAWSHEPGYTESWSPGDCDYDGNLCTRNLLLPLFAEHDFHLYMSGHTHAYERGMVDGVLNLISGGGGGGLDEWCKDWPQTKVVYQDHHFLKVDVGCETMRLEAVNLAGETVDWVEIPPTPPGEIIDEGPKEGLPALIISSDSPEA